MFPISSPPHRLSKPVSRRPFKSLPSPASRDIFLLRQLIGGGGAVEELGEIQKNTDSRVEKKFKHAK